MCFNLKVILTNVQSMRGMLEGIQRYKGELHLPQGAEENLLVFSRATLLLQTLKELEDVTEQQTMLLEVEYDRCVQQIRLKRHILSWMSNILQFWLSKKQQNTLQCRSSIMLLKSWHNIKYLTFNLLSLFDLSHCSRSRLEFLIQRKKTMRRTRAAIRPPLTR